MRLLFFCAGADVGILLQTVKFITFSLEADNVTLQTSDGIRKVFNDPHAITSTRIKNL